MLWKCTVTKKKRKIDKQMPVDPFSKTAENMNECML